MQQHRGPTDSRAFDRALAGWRHKQARARMLGNEPRPRVERLGQPTFAGVVGRVAGRVAAAGMGRAG